MRHDLAAFALFLPLLCAPLGAQEKATDEPAEKPARRTLQPADYGQWESLRGGALSPDGRWMAWEVRTVSGDGELRVRMLATEENKVFEHGSRPVFSADSRWLTFRIGRSEAAREKLVKAKKPIRNRLGLLDLMSGEQSEVEGVASSSFSDDGRFLVMRRYPAKGRESRGADIVVRDLASGVDTGFGNVASHAWNDDGTLLAMVIDAEQKSGNGVQLYEATGGRLRTLDSSEREYGSLTWREDAADLAFLRKTEHEEDEDPTHVVVAWSGLGGAEPARRSFDHRKAESFPEGMRVVDFAGLRWADDGAALFFGIKEWENPPEEKAEESEKSDAKEKDAKKEGEKDSPAKTKSLRESLKDPAGVQVWHAKDIDIIPRQEKVAAMEERRSFLSAFWLESGRLVQLGDELTESVTLLEKQRYAIGRDNTPYEREKMFGPTLVDAFAIDTASGARERVLERLKFFLGSSPDGESFLYVRDAQIWLYDIAAKAHRNLGGALATSFINDLGRSLTDEHPPFGVAGWSADGSQVYLHDRYDLWKVATDGSGGERLTSGAEGQVRHRRLVLDRELEEFIDPGKPMFLSLYGDRDKRSGFARLVPGQEPERLLWSEKRLGSLKKAEKAAVFAFAEQDFSDSPDLFIAGPNLGDARQVTRTNPFQDEFLWGHSELVDYESTSGDALQGALFYPAGYEPGKKYPMIVYIYELRSQTLHSYSAPTERHPYNPTVFTHQGYLVFQPDIVYRAQNPGLSALECVEPAVRAVIAKGIVDEQRIGLVGHSWGAYQTAFLVTRSELFAAGVAGAPLTNMMSMSMSIYWNSGQTDAWIFHESQGRMDRPFWKDVSTYIENSPIFGIEKMKAALLIAFGDEDGAVDWHQGIEMYNAARLAGKDLVMLVYPGENHSLRKKPNQVDYHHRVLEWFAHYLKGADAPKWIEEGKSFLERKKELEEHKKKRKGPKEKGKGD